MPAAGWGWTGSLPLVRRCRRARWCGAISRGLPQNAFKQRPAVAAAMRGLDQIFRMRHETEHIAAIIDDAGNVVERAVGIGALGVAEHDLAFALDARERLGVGKEIAVV